MKGYSLVELVVVTFLFTALTAVLALAWTKGARSITYSNKVTARLNELTLVRHRMERELAQTQSLSLQTRPTMLAFGLGGDDYFRHLAQWPSLCLYYYANNCLYRRELAAPLDHPLDDYGHDGQAVATQLTAFEVSQVDNLLRVKIESGRFHLDSTTRVRN